MVKKDPVVLNEMEALETITNTMTQHEGHNV